jgi:hypothetical protein
MRSANVSPGSSGSGWLSCEEKASSKTFALVCRMAHHPKYQKVGVDVPKFNLLQVVDFVFQLADSGIGRNDNIERYRFIADDAPEYARARHVRVSKVLVGIAIQVQGSSLLIIYQRPYLPPWPFVPPVIRLSKYNTASHIRSRVERTLSDRDTSSHLRIRPIPFRSRCSSSRVCMCSALLQKSERTKKSGRRYTGQ